LFTETSIRRSRQIPILVAFAVLLISMLVLIQDLDRLRAGLGGFLGPERRHVWPVTPDTTWIVTQIRLLSRWRGVQAIL